MMVTLEEMKNYLRVDYEDDDALIQSMITAAIRQCMDILRTDSEEDLAAARNGKIAVVFCQALFPEKSVGIPFFQQGIFPVSSGHYASLRMRACSIR